jgi:serine/threonine protein kinase
MFKVGMGDTPAVPEELSDEGHAFLELCLQHDPHKRATAQELLEHTFVKYDNMDADLDDTSSLQTIISGTSKILLHSHLSPH